MYKVTRGAIHYKGVVYRKDEVIPETFDNKAGYSNVAYFESEQELKKKQDDEIKRKKEIDRLSTLESKVAELEKANGELESRAVEAESKVAELEKANGEKQKAKK